MTVFVAKLPPLFTTKGINTEFCWCQERENFFRQFVRQDCCEIHCRNSVDSIDLDLDLSGYLNHFQISYVHSMGN